MNYKITWEHPSPDKPTVLEQVRLNKELIQSLEAQYNDKIIAVKPIH